MESEPAYQYVGGNVVNRIDPSGKQGCPPEIPMCNDPWQPIREMWETAENFSVSHELVNAANRYYGKDNPYWNCRSNDNRLDPQDDWYQVVRDFVCESGPEPHEFKDNYFRLYMDSKYLVYAPNIRC